MPGLNQSGPMGQGPMTGRRMGRCTSFGTDHNNQNRTISENQAKGQPDNFPDRGLGLGRIRGKRGNGMRWQNRFRDGSY